MSLRDDLLEKAGELVDDKASEWADKAIERARAELPHLVEEANKLLPDGAKVDEDQACDIINLVDDGKAPLIRLGTVGFAWVVANLESGEEAEAKRRYLETQATFDERRAAMQAAGDAAFDEAKERSDAWEAAKAVLEAIGEAGLKILVALARKAVGI